ncbi:hypothetical protein ACFZCU_44380 [Streptomyces canus]|uniref:hypothetical protein n=1 Tax=Streptomyces canus TaxID=58343 RepID=UPI0036E814CC
MDSYTGDAAGIGEVVLGVAAGDWAPGVQATFAQPVGYLLVMDRDILEPGWRGMGLGPVLAGSAIRRLSQGEADEGDRRSARLVPVGAGRTARPARSAAGSEPVRTGPQAHRAEGPACRFTTP